jgi:hypothetical protein
LAENIEIGVSDMLPHSPTYWVVYGMLDDCTKYIDRTCVNQSSSLCVYPSATRRTTSASVLLICIN